MTTLDEIKRGIAKIRNPWFRARSHYIKYYENLPIDEKSVLLESQHGTEISGNIFYIVDYLSKNEGFKDLKIYVPSWIRHRKKISGLLKAHNISNVKIVTYASEEYFQLLASAKFLVNDNTFDPSFIKKEGQVYLNTWHGTPLKALGKKMSSGFHSIGNAQKNFIVSDYMLFPNQHTRDALLKDYMVENISKTVEIYGGYPRNTVFFNKDLQLELQKRFNPDRKKIYAYMPTFRGTPSTGGTDKNDIYLKYFLFELDRQLADDEILYVNLHPVARKSVSFGIYSHIKMFPSKLETYEFLSIVDCLVTDYSSVFFDFVNTEKKVILFAYDKEEYLADRGMYLDLSELPFPIVSDVESLLREMRQPKGYDDTAFRDTFCSYDNQDATKQLCDIAFGGNPGSLITKQCKSNGKENVLIYTGNLADNGITTSIRNLMSLVDLEKRNYYLTFKADSVAKFAETLRTFPDGVNYISMIGDMNVTIFDRIIRKFFKKGWISASRYVKLQKNRLQQNWQRCFGCLEFDTAIQFNGYEAEIILMWSQFQGNKAIFVHSDMVKEIATRGNQRMDVLQYAYQQYNKVAVVTEDIIEPTYEISGCNENIRIVKNAINWELVQKKSEGEIMLDSFTKLSISHNSFLDIMNSSITKFISIGRFSPEKGHDRLIKAFKRFSEKESDVCLIIVGGGTTGNCYLKLMEQIQLYNLEGKVILLQRVSNPYPILNTCDYFVLSSLYEGFGLVIAEADILGKPAISTDIPGPRRFMNTYGGVMVESSEEGIYQGLCMLYEGKVKPMNVDYAAYNEEVLAEFEQLFQKEE